MTESDDVCVHIFVEQLDDGAYDVVTRKDDQPWLRHGPFEDLDYANMIPAPMAVVPKRRHAAKKIHKKSAAVRKRGKHQTRWLRRTDFDTS